VSPKDFHIELTPLTDDDLRARNLPDSMLWFIKEDEILKGPYEEAALRDYAVRNSSFMADYEACNAEDKLWKTVFEHPRLQRRQTPQRDEEDSGYFVLVKGQKNGPFTQEEVIEKLKRFEVTYTDLLSADGGKTWMRTYDFSEFNRREDNSSLPFLPDEAMFKKASLATHDFLQSQKRLESLNEQDAIVGLAYEGEDYAMPSDDDIPAIIDEDLVGPSVGKGEQLSAEEAQEAMLPAQEMSVPKDGDEVIAPLTEQQKKARTKKVAMVTGGALVLILAFVSGGSFFFNSPKKSQEVSTSAPKARTPMKQNYRQNKNTINPGTTRRAPAAKQKTRAEASTPNPNYQKQQQLRDAFKDARKMQMMHQNQPAKKVAPTNQPARPVDMDREPQSDEMFEADPIDDAREPNQDEYEEAQDLVEEIQQEQFERDPQESQQDDLFEEESIDF
jgi:hypothetical protein